MADVADGLGATEPIDQGAPRPRRPFLKVTVVLVVFALIAGVLLAKVLVPQSSLTSAHNDAVVDYEAAVKAGRPIYVLFHSLT
jgi:hypothetical protein